MQNGTPKLLDRIEMILMNTDSDSKLSVWIDIFDNSLSRRWLQALEQLLNNNNHLEKNYCWFGFPTGPRTGQYILDQVNASIQAINRADIGYTINDYISYNGALNPDLSIVHERFNRLHRYFEDLQGTSGNMSKYYNRADDATRWHIRQLNLLCHEFESWALSNRKLHTSPEWMRPSQLMCWINAPRFELTDEDLELFGIETINRELGGVYVGVNKAVGKHHWEVFNDEGKHGKMLDELTTSVMRGQTEAAGDFDIEWANNPGAYEWQQRRLAEFRDWLQANGIDPEDRQLTIGHPQVGQVDLLSSFGTNDYRSIWAQLTDHLNVYQIKTSRAQATYKYNWSDKDFQQRQIQALKGITYEMD